MPFTLEEVSKHNNAASCWVVIKSHVYDVTEFLSEHPGGSAIILKYAGRDATLAYDPIHPPDALKKNLAPSKHLGPLDSASSKHLQFVRDNRAKTKDEARIEQAMKERPPINRLLSIADIEDVAQKVLSYKARAYYSSAADDHISHDENTKAFSRFFFNARVMRPVSGCDPSTTILGHKSAIPVFVSAAGLAKLGHPLGEVNITRGASKGSIIQTVSSNASSSYSEIAAATSPGQTLFFQLYKSADDNLAAKRIQEVESLGYKAIFLTVDAVVAGRREVDIRSPWELDVIESGKQTYYSEQDDPNAVDDLGTSGALVGKDDQDMTWEKTIPWLRRVTKLPIVLKGVQCVEDALLAADAGVDGILLSNHGGRQLDYSMPPLEVLYRLRKHHPEVFNKMEVYIDGGVRRGTDVLKALCLGARAVGMGRPFLYAQSAYGDAGVAKAISILENEIIKGMKFLGASRVTDLVPEMVERVDWQPFVKTRL
ncbi:FMN-dependent dehydrogenase-domain-containing protein [Mucidula mucida]|nr:FMN-dependent dehydrogenase-domain-containing protein [Mucidula mucida]